MKKNRTFNQSNAFGLLLIISIVVQSAVAQNNRTSDTSYFSYSQKQISKIVNKEGNKSEVKNFYRSGNLQSVQNYENNISDGEHRFWYENEVLSQLIIYQSGQKITEKQWYENGILSIEHHFLYQESISRVNNYNNKFHGVFIENYQSGQKKIVGFYDSGMKTKTWTEYFESGKPSLKAEYKYGIFNGTVETWYSNGKTKTISEYKIIANTNLTSPKDKKVIRSYKKSYDEEQNEDLSKDKRWKSVKNGKFIRFYENGKISQSSKYKDGYMHGDFKTWGVNGNLLNWKQYKNGFISGKSNRYYSDGKPQELKNEYQSNSYNSYFDGKYINYYKNGVIKNVSNYKNKKLEGEFIENFENGKLKTKAKYQNGNLIGEYIIYREDGRINTSVNYVSTDKNKTVMDGPYYNNNYESITKGTYIKGQKNGLWQTWSNNKLISEEQFCNGKHCGLTRKWNQDGDLTEELIYSNQNNKLIKKAIFKDNQLSLVDYYNELGFRIKSLSLENNQIKSIKYEIGGSNTKFESKKLSRVIEFFDNGNLKSDFHQLDYNSIGMVFNYYLNGQPMKVETFSHNNDKENNFFVLWDPAGQIVECRRTDKTIKIINKSEEQQLYQLALKNNIQQQFYKKDSSIESFSGTAKIETINNGMSYQLLYWNGKPCLIYEFKNNLANGVIKQWSFNGNQILNGACENGIRKGLWVENNNNGSKIKESIYSNDTMWHKEYYENQQLKEVYSKKRNNLFGESLAYYQNGQMQQQGFNVNGNANGLFKTWYENGVLQSESNYKFGMLFGPNKEYWNNGNLKKHGLYKNNNQDGIWEHFDENGELLVMIDYQKGKQSYYYNNKCKCNNTSVELPIFQNNDQFKENALVKKFKNYIFKDRESIRDTLTINNLKQTKTDTTEQISFTAYYDDKFVTNNRNYNNYGLFYNPCYNPKNKTIAIPFTLNKTNEKYQLKANVNQIGFRFSKYLITPSDKRFEGFSSYHFSELSFKMAFFRVSNDSVIFENPHQFCFEKSKIVGSSIHFDIDSFEIKYNKSYQIKKPFDSLNSSHYFERFLLKKYYSSYNNLYFETKNARFFLPENFFDTSKNKEQFVEINGNMVLTETKLFAAIKFEALQTADSIYKIKIKDQFYNININEFLEHLKKHNDNSYSQYEFQYLPKTKELLIYISKNN